MTMAFGGGASKDDVGRIACALAPTVTYAWLMPSAVGNSSRRLVVMTTCTHENDAAPWHAGGTGAPGRLMGGELSWTLLVKPPVALHGRATTSKHVAVNDEPVLWSQPVEYSVGKPLFAA